jgi:aspartyl protease family protein
MDKGTPQGGYSLRIGKGMVIAAWVLLLVMLTLLFNNLLERQRNPNRVVQSVVLGDQSPAVILKRNRYGHYVASGLINGKPVEFMLDTGASDVSIPESLARKLGLRRGRPVQYRTANGTITAHQTTLDTVQLGDIVIGPVSASINPGSRDHSVLLGMSFLKHLDFNQQGDTLTLKTRE